jgi:hypothetical protein
VKAFLISVVIVACVVAQYGVGFYAGFQYGRENANQEIRDYYEGLLKVHGIQKGLGP